MGPQIFIGANSQVYGPYEFAHVQAGVRRGEIGPQHMLSYDGRQWFPAQAIWPQLLGQAGFGPSAPTMQMPSPGTLGAAPIAQARPVPQAQYAATPAHDVPPGVAQAAEAVDAEASSYSPWPGRILALLMLVLVVGAWCEPLRMVLLRLPFDDEIVDGPVPTYLSHAYHWSHYVALPAVYVMLGYWGGRAALRLLDRGITPPPYSPGLTATSLLVPAFNLVMAPLALQRLWKSSDWAARNNRRPQPTAMIPVWWFPAVAGECLFYSDQITRIMVDPSVRRGRLVMQRLEEFLPSILPTAAVLDAAVWTLGLALFVMFDSRVRTRVEMG